MGDPYTTDEWRGFVNAVRAAPDDDGLRLVAADWLEEVGRPGRAANIRRGVAALPGHPHGPAARWVQKRLGWWRRLTWSRGFLERVECPAEAWVPAADALLAREPVLSVRLASSWDFYPDRIPGDPRGRRFGIDDVQEAGRRVKPAALFTERHRLGLLSLRWPEVEKWELPAEAVAFGSAAESLATLRRLLAAETDPRSPLQEQDAAAGRYQEAVGEVVAEALDRVGRPLWPAEVTPPPTPGPPP